MMMMMITKCAHIWSPPRPVLWWPIATAWNRHCCCHCQRPRPRPWREDIIHAPCNTKRLFCVVLFCYDWKTKRLKILLSRFHDLSPMSYWDGAIKLLKWQNPTAGRGARFDVVDYTRLTTCFCSVWQVIVHGWFVLHCTETVYGVEHFLSLSAATAEPHHWHQNRQQQHAVSITKTLYFAASFPC